MSWGWVAAIGLVVAAMLYLAAVLLLPDGDDWDDWSDWSN